MSFSIGSNPITRNVAGIPESGDTQRSRPEPGSSPNHHRPIELIACLFAFLRYNESARINYCFEARCKTDRRKKLYPYCLHR